MENSENNIRHKLYTDGGARGNPGPSGIGGVLLNPDGFEVAVFKEFIGDCTNNVAEYRGLMEGLRLALENRVSNLDVFMDSELIVKQIRGEYKVKNPNLQVLRVDAQKLINQFNSITFTHVKRAGNKRADGLVNEALDEQLENKSY